MEDYAPFIGLAALIIALIAWLRADNRKLDNSISELSSRTDAQVKELREADQASEQRLLDAIAAQGKEFREADAALAKELRDAYEAQGKELRERMDGLAKEVAGLSESVAVVKARLDRPLLVKVVRDEFDDAA